MTDIFVLNLKLYANTITCYLKYHNFTAQRSVLPIDFSFAKVITHYFLFYICFSFHAFHSQFAYLAYELRPLASQLTRC
jgi:hypothetical protein